MSRHIVLEPFTAFHKGHHYLVVPMDVIEIKRIVQGVVHAALSIINYGDESMTESIDIEFPHMYAIPREWITRIEGDDENFNY